MELAFEDSKQFPLPAELNEMVKDVHDDDQRRPFRNLKKPQGVPADIERLAREIEQIGKVKVKQTGSQKLTKTTMSPITPTTALTSITEAPPVVEVKGPPRTRMCRRSCAANCLCGISSTVTISDVPEAPEPIISKEIFEEVQQRVISISLLERDTPAPQINAVSSPSKLKWVRVPIAMDSGSMANVTPPQIFSCLIQATDASKNKEKFHGADASPILNLGSQHVSGQSDSETPVNIDVDFEVANITRPLGSVSKLVKKKNIIVFDEGEGNSYIQNKTSGEKVSLREENGLYYLDVWVQVPEDMVMNPSVARQVEA